MKKLLYYSLFVMLILSACSNDPCAGNKDQFLTDYHTLIQSAGDADMKAGDKGWEKYDEQFRAMVEECYQFHEPELTRGERRTFWAKSVEYYYHRYGGEVLSAVNEKDDDLSRRIKREVQSRWDRTGDALDEALMSAQKNWKKAKKRIEKGINN